MPGKNIHGSHFYTRTASNNSTIQSEFELYKTEGNNDNRQIRDPKLLLDEQLVIKKKFLSIIPQ